jgi:hypothetical protein
MGFFQLIEFLKIHEQGWVLDGLAPPNTQSNENKII